MIPDFWLLKNDLISAWLRGWGSVFFSVCMSFLAVLLTSSNAPTGMLLTHSDVTINVIYRVYEALLMKTLWIHEGSSVLPEGIWWHLLSLQKNVVLLIEFYLQYNLAVPLGQIEKFRYLVYKKKKREREIISKIITMLTRASSVINSCTHPI